MAKDMEDKAQRKIRFLKIALAGSLAVNLLIAGMALGVALRSEYGIGKRFQDPRLAAFGAPYMLAMPREERRMIARALRSDASSGLPDRRMRREMYKQVLHQLRSEPFDAEALRQAVDQQARTAIAVQGKLQGAWIEAVMRMDAPQRHAYADAVEAALRRHSGGRR